MTKIGIGMPGHSVAETRASAEAASQYNFDSFSVYGDLGDLPPYAVLHASADVLRNSSIEYIGPMGTPVGLQHPEQICQHARALDEQLPGQSSIGLVRGAFLKVIEENPATLAELEIAVSYLQSFFANRDHQPPIYIGGFGPKLLQLAGRLGVQGVKLGGTTNPTLAERSREALANPDVSIVMGAVSVIDPDRKAARRLARQEVAKYLHVVGRFDPTLDEDESSSLTSFIELYEADYPDASKAISDGLLDKFALSGTPEDALVAIESMSGTVDRFEFGTPHGLTDRPTAIKMIGDNILKELGD